MEAKNMKITKDGFVWLTVNSDKATEIWKKAVFMFILYHDDSEGLIESEVQLANAISSGMQIGIEVGQIKKIRQTIKIRIIV